MTFYTVKEVAQILQVSEDTVRALIRKGDLLAVNVSVGSQRPRWRVPEGALKAFQSKHLNLAAKPSVPPPRFHSSRGIREAEDVDAFIARWRKRLKKAGAPEGAPRRSK